MEDKMHVAETESGEDLNEVEIHTPAEWSGLKLKKLREKKGYTTKELARQSGISERTIVKFEKGISDINGRPCEEIIQLVYAIGGRCRMEDLLNVERFDVRAYEEEQRMNYMASIKRMKIENPEQYARMKEAKAKKKQELEQQKEKLAEQMRLAQEKLAEQMRQLQDKQQKLKKQTDDEDFELYEV